MTKILEVYQNPSTLVLWLWRSWDKLSNGTIGILIETVWGQMFHFWKFFQNTLSPWRVENWGFWEMLKKCILSPKMIELKNSGYHQKVLLKSFPKWMVMWIGSNNLKYSGQFLCPALCDRSHYHHQSLKSQATRSITPPEWIVGSQQVS
jgi:hypothetical protein